MFVKGLTATPPLKKINKFVIFLASPKPLQYMENLDYKNRKKEGSQTLILIVNNSKQFEGSFENSLGGRKRRRNSRPHN